MQNCDDVYTTLSISSSLFAVLFPYEAVAKPRKGTIVDYYVSNTLDYF